MPATNSDGNRSPKFPVAFLYTLSRKQGKETVSYFFQCFNGLLGIKKESRLIDIIDTLSPILIKG